MVSMKITIELPDAMFRRAKTVASGRGMTLKRFLIKALEEQLRRYSSETDAPWMEGFGVLSDLSDENCRVLDIIEQEFEMISPEDIA